MDIPLIDESDVVSRKKDRGERKERNATVKKKKEKPVLVLRIKYHDKLSLPFMEGGKLGHKEFFAVNRGLIDLLNSLYYDTNIEISAPPDCIFVAKDDRVGFNNKFIFIEISKNEVDILKKGMEYHTTIYAYNQGEFTIIEGGRSYLREIWNMPRIWK